MSRYSTKKFNKLQKNKQYMNNQEYSKRFVWRNVYRFYPRILRILEKIKIHNVRQDYLIGKLVDNFDLNEVKNVLTQNGFENAILSWKDPGEVINMRLVDKDLYQYHIRIFNDGEVRGHYEYSSEGNPWKHVKEGLFVEKKEYFSDLLNGFLK